MNPLQKDWERVDLAAVRIQECTLNDPPQLQSGTPQTLGGSFSALSRPIFATKYSFCSIFRDLQDLRTFAPLQIQNFSKNRPQFLQIEY